jgi:four helix bundle protein
MSKGVRGYSYKNNHKTPTMAEQIRSFRDLHVYQEAFDLQQLIFNMTKPWPDEEKFALTNQVRRSSRSIGANISEAWAKRRYPSHFVSKLTDADGELQETYHWTSTALACGYITRLQISDFEDRMASIGKRLGKMMSMPEKFKPH